VTAESQDSNGLNADMTTSENVFTIWHLFIRLNFVFLLNSQLFLNSVVVKCTETV